MIIISIRLRCLLLISGLCVSTDPACEKIYFSHFHLSVSTSFPISISYFTSHFPHNRKKSKNHMIHFVYVSHGFTYYFTYYFTYCFSTETIVPENASTSESSPVYVTFTLSPTETFSNPCGFASKLNS